MTKLTVAFHNFVNVSKNVITANIHAHTGHVKRLTYVPLAFVCLFCINLKLFVR